MSFYTVLLFCLGVGSIEMPCRLVHALHTWSICYHECYLLPATYYIKCSQPLSPLLLVCYRELLKVSHIRTVYNIFAAILIIFSIQTIVYDLLEQGRWVSLRLWYSLYDVILIQLCFEEVLLSIFHEIIINRTEILHILCLNKDILYIAYNVM